LVKHQETVNAVNKILDEYSFPLTLRQIYYRLVAKNAIPNKRSAYNGLSKILVKARENGEVDDTRIEDRSRGVLEAPKGYDSPEEFIESMKRFFKASPPALYHANLWGGQDTFVEVWIEKDALSRVIQQIAEPLRVTVAPSRGYSSYTFIKRDAVDNRFDEIDPKKPIIILDFRDHDPSGIQMTEDLQTRFTTYGKGRSIEVKRIALTIDQVRQHDLPPNPTKIADTRSGKYRTRFGDKCWELDAIEPGELQKIVRDAIEGCIDKRKWNQSLEREGQERQELIERFKKVRITV